MALSAFPALTAIAAFLLLVAEAPAISQSEGADPLERALSELGEGKGQQALTRLDELLRKARTAEAIAAIQPVRAAAFGLLKRDADAVAAIRAAYEAAPSSDFPARYALGVGTAISSFELASAGADRLISHLPESARQLKGQDVWDFFRLVRTNKGQAGVDDYYARFAAVGIGATDPVVHDEIAYLAAAVHLKRGDADRARALTDNIQDAQVLARILTEKRFEPIWVATEARVEPAMAKATRASVARAEAVFAAERESIAARVALMQAYAMAGRLPEAEGVGAAFAPNPEDIAKIDEAGGWLIDRHARLLRVLDRKDAAEARYAALRVLKIDEYPWLINMVINRVEFLVREGDYRRAETLLDEAEMLTKAYGSAYARQLIRRHRVCLMAGTGQPFEPALEALRAHASDSRMVTVEGLQCAGKADEAALLVLAELADPDSAADMVESMQPVDAIWENDPSVWREARSSLLKRPDVAAAFAKIGRILPRAYWPRPKE